VEIIKRKVWIRRLACAGTLLSGLKLQVQLAVGEIADFRFDWLMGAGNFSLIG